MDVADAEKKIIPRTKAMVTVDYTEHPCNYGALWKLACRHNLTYPLTPILT